MFRNFLKEILVDKITIIVSTAAFNLMKYKREVQLYLYLVILRFLTVFCITRNRNV
jgi:hypothetical protein